MMKISCSRAQTISTCGRMYDYSYVQRLTTVSRSFALFFGTVVDKAVSGYVFNHALAKSFDIVSCFEEEFDREIQLNEIQYPAHWDADVAREVGLTMCSTFPGVWEKSNLVAVVDSEGVPVVQRRIIAPITKDLEVEVVLDCLVMDTLSGDFGPLDFKTTSQMLSPESPFGYNSLQLTTQQYGVDYMFGDYLGQVSNVGFMELVKRKPPKGSGKGPTVEPPRFYPRRSNEQIRDMKHTYLSKAKDIAEKRFYRPTNGAYNNPCDMCDFARLCVSGDRQGITIRPARHAA